MVTRFLPSIASAAGLLLVQAGLGQNIPFYQVGDIATNDVVTPIPLMVTDPEATTLLKAKELQEVRSIFLYAPSTADEAERAFRSHMALLREEFVRDLTAAYGVSKVDKSVERTQKFLDLTGSFRQKHNGTPKLFLYMPYWAQGRSDEHLLADWVRYIRRSMDQPVRIDRLPAADITTTVRMITVPSLDVEVQLEHAERYGVLTPLDNIVPLARARADMAADFPEDDAYISKFLGPFVKPNCVFDEALTRASREKRVDSLVVAANYTAGEKVVRTGQVIDAKTVAALQALREQLPKRDQSSSIPITPAPGEGREWLWMVLAGTAGGVLVLIGLMVFMRRKPETQTAMVRADSARIRSSRINRSETELLSDQETEAELDSERLWRERALAAERKAEKAKALARDKVTDALKDKVVQHLSTQRDELIDDQLTAAEQMAGMEARLERIQGPVSERLKAYESRIAELEDQLSAKDQENRALIQAKLDNIREQISRAKAARNFDWN